MSEAMNVSSGGATDPAGLLAEITALRRRTRTQRQAYGPPLLVFGLLAVAATPLYVSTALPDPDQIAGEAPATPLLVGLGGNWMDHSVMLGRYWLGALLGGYLFSLWWYRRRAEQSGVQTSTRRYLQVAVAGVGIGLAFPALVYLALDHWDVPPGFLNAVLTTIHYGLVPFLILGAGLLALARLERSTLLAAVAGGELLATALGVAYFRIGSFGADGIGAYDRMFAALAPGAVLLAGGVLATLRARRIAV